VLVVQNETGDVTTWHLSQLPSFTVAPEAVGMSAFHRLFPFEGGKEGCNGAPDSSMYLPNSEYLSLLAPASGLKSLSLLNVRYAKMPTTSPGTVTVWMKMPAVYSL